MGKRDKETPEEAKNAGSGDKGGEPEIKAGGWDDQVKVRSREFNGPAGVDEALRIAMTKEAYADLIGHAKETLDREICGVLLGDLCEDEYGRFISIRTALRGGAAKAGGTHVTFTQETWNEIHLAKEERYPKLQIVGWYHSHPGFGVEFSDMDLFIQKNFFGGPGQIAFVSDPLGGEEAIVANVGGQIVPVARFWVDGRERRCYVPSGHKASGGGDGAKTAVSSDVTASIRGLEDRVRQLTETVERQRNTFYNFLTFLGVLLACCFLMTAGYSIWRAHSRPIEMPEDMNADFTVPIPIVVDGKPSLVTLGMKKWSLSPELQDRLWKALLAQHKEEEAAATRAAAAAATASAPASKPATIAAPKTP